MSNHIVMQYGDTSGDYKKRPIFISFGNRLKINQSIKQSINHPAYRRMECSVEALQHGSLAKPLFLPLSAGREKQQTESNRSVADMSRGTLPQGSLQPSPQALHS